MEESKIKARRVAKDSVFCDLFDDAHNQLKLYQLLHPEDQNVTAADFHTVTINNILTDQSYNDLGFVVKDKLLILAEAQSTWSVNIIPRILLYLAQTIKDWIMDHNQNVYGSKKVIFPKPEFYVVYTGESQIPLG